MNALVKKEIRLLLPNLSLAVVMALGVWVIPTDSQPQSGLSSVLQMLPMILCATLILVIALDSFGREISNHTFAHLLAQPVSRERVWWTKTSLLAGALLIVFGVWWLSFMLHVPSYFLANPGDVRSAFTFTMLLVAVAYSGGLWTVLLLRQVGAAFWITLLVPAALAMLTGYLVDKSGHENLIGSSIAIVLGAYSVAGFWWARRLFLRAQDLQWGGGQITLPGWFKFPILSARSSHVAGQRPWLALVGKELQLHQSVLVIAGGLTVLHLVPVLIRKYYAGWKDAALLEFFVEAFWILWFILPILVGCTAVAEERKLGMLESQLCLPVRRRTQFVIKLSVALFLALGFAVAMPLLLEGGRILPSPDSFKLNESNHTGSREAFFAPSFSMLHAWAFIQPLLPYVPFVIFAVALLLISFYASTLTRNTLQAFGPAILGILIAWTMLGGAAIPATAFGFPIWRGWLIYLIGVPVLTLTLARLAVGNFQRVFVGLPAWRWNLGVFIAALLGVMSVTSLIYHRTWEIFTALEPAPGPVLLARTDARLVNSGSGTTVALLPDGRVWLGRFIPDVKSATAALLGNWRLSAVIPGGRFLDGTNWISVATTPGQIAGVTADGSLWAMAEAQKPQDYWKPRTNREPQPIKLDRVGNANDWKTVAGQFAIKTDGTLWRWGTGAFPSRTNRSQKAFAPRRLGSESDWVRIGYEGWMPVFYKADGSAWAQGGWLASSKTNETLKLDQHMTLGRSKIDRAGVWRTKVFVSGSRERRFAQFIAGLREDGAIGICGVWKLPHGKRSGTAELTEANIQLGRETNWVALAGDQNTMVALRTDGTLWRWKFPRNPIDDPESARVARLGSRSDWVALEENWHNILCVSADGNLWWRPSLPERLPSDTIFQPLLAPSRKPQLLANVFGKTP